MALKDKLIALPTKPGIYRFLDREGSLMYIGKAKNLNSRVNSYFLKSASLTSVKRQMVSEAKKVEYTVVDNETEALLLEAGLIKKHQPPYNIVLKDDKSWLYLMITKDEYPQLVAVRQTDRKFKTGRKFFGPYTSSSSVRQTLKLLRQLFPYFTAKGPLVELGTKIGSPYHLGRYLQNRKIAKTDWLRNLELIGDFLSGRTESVAGDLEKKMKQASKRKEYEKAALLRDQLKALSKILVSQKVVSPRNENDDYLGLSSIGHQVVITLLKVRRGRLLDQLNFPLKNLKPLSQEEILEQFLEKYYGETEDLPKNVYLPVKASASLKTLVPIKGRKRELIKLAEENAKTYLENSLAAFEKEKVKTDKGLNELVKALKLKKAPERIEAYDISNILGKQATGSMVVLTKGKIDKKEYRLFRIKTVRRADDPAMMAEVVKRRLKNNWPKPDLILIDGGLTQLNAASKVLPKKMPIIALAKKQEEIYLPGQAIPLRLPKFSPALQLLQTVRDEAHRFAVSYHRKLRKKEIINS